MMAGFTLLSRCWMYYLTCSLVSFAALTFPKRDQIDLTFKFAMYPLCFCFPQIVIRRLQPDQGARDWLHLFRRGSEGRRGGPGRLAAEDRVGDSSGYGYRD